IGTHSSFCGGALIRHRLHKQIFLESGINYIYRIYSSDIHDGSVNISRTFRFINYEIPIQGLIYIQTAKNSFVNNTFGISLDFFPNDVRVTDSIMMQLAVRRYWVLPAIIASTGYEYRTKKN